MAMIMKETRTHSTNVALSEPSPSEVAVGGAFVAKIKVSCPAGCDLRAMPLEVTGPDGLVSAMAADPDPDQRGETRDIALQAPLGVREQTWTVRFPPHESEGVRHEACALPVSIRTRPHATSLAVWAALVTPAAIA